MYTLHPFRLLACLLAMLAAAPASAHPYDEAVVYHYHWIEVKQGRLSLQFAAGVGGLLAGAVWPALDADGDGLLPPGEQALHARRLARELTLRVNGRPVAWEVREFRYPDRAGFYAADLDAALRVRLEAVLPAGARAGEIVLRDETFIHHTGVFPAPVLKPDGAGRIDVEEDGRLMRVRLGAPGGAPEGGTPPRGSLAGRPPDAPEASGVERGPQGLPESLDPEKLFPQRGGVIAAAPERRERAGARDLAGFLDRPLSPAVVILALGAAVVAGMAHALTPGHGKALVGAYLVGSRGTVRDALLLGVIVTITHTAGVYVLGFLCLWLVSGPQAVAVGHWLELGSGVLVLGMGFWLMQRGILAYHGLGVLPGHTHGPGGHEHGAAGAGHAHAHGHALGAAGVGPPSPARQRVPPADSPREERAGGAAPRPWGLVGLGVAGGMVPCFDALVVLLAAVNLRQVGLGLLLIAAFSVGMAAVLVAIGVVMVRAGETVRRFTGEARWVRALPAVSGGLLFVLGIWLTLGALAGAGIVRFG